MTHYDAMTEARTEEHNAFERSLENYDMTDVDNCESLVFIGTGDSKRLVAKFWNHDLCFEFIWNHVYAFRSQKMTRIDECERVYFWDAAHGRLDVLIEGLDF